MIITRIDGGIGNQFFQYAIARALSLDVNEPLVLDLRQLYSRGHRDFVLADVGAPSDRIIFNEFDLTIFDKIVSSIFCVRERSVNFDAKVIRRKKFKYLKGYWQTEKYFSGHRPQIIRDLTSNGIFDAVSKLPLNTKITASIHIRRGDYVNHEKYFSLGDNYYREAARIAISEQGIEQFLIFSDDTEWVKENLKFKNGTFADKMGLSALEELYLMSRCRVNIIANSTFSWWAGYLNANEDRTVLCPKVWFGSSMEQPRDLYPADWRQLDC